MLSPYDNEPFITIMSMIMAVMTVKTGGVEKWNECHYCERK